MQTLLYRMHTARIFEERVLSYFREGALHGTMHPGIGEEGSAVGAAMALAGDDYMLATHRGHGPAIGKGADIQRMMAEIFGRETGSCRGRGGSMHITDFSCGMLGANGIVGANAPIACGAAFTIKRKGLGRVCASFLGDGALNEGAVHESMNLAAVWQLPVLFIVVNNGYGMSTPLSAAMRDTDLKKRAVPYGLPAYGVDGNDAVAVYAAVKQARAKAAAGGGPAFIVCDTYRTEGHSKSDKNLYRTPQEIARWRARCPIRRLCEALLGAGILDARQLEAVRARAAQTVDDAVAFAKSSPPPNPDTLMEDVYAR